ncbi:MAG: Hint domain-containing protein, partial [Gemmatimonas sp.]
DRGGKGLIYSKFLDNPFPIGNVDDTVCDLGGEILVGQDFNINPMASVIAVKAIDECHVLDCLLIETSNTPEVCAEIQRRYPGRRVVFCPDPAGRARHTNAKAGQTDFTIIESFGFQIRAPMAHPPVVDRINNVNLNLCDSKGRRRVRVHPKAANLITALSNQTYKDGTNIPDKSNGYDHPCFDGDTVVETPTGFMPIADLPWAGMVRGPLGGWVQYVGARRTRIDADVIELRFESGETVTCTPDHRWLTSRGWVRAVDLTQITGYIEL